MQEVHLGATFQYMKFLLFFCIFSYLSYLEHPSLLGLQRPEERATFLLSSYSSPITQRHLWAPQWTFICMLCASARKSAPRGKWHVLVPLNGFPWFKHHSVALSSATIWHWNEVFPSSGSGVAYHWKSGNFQYSHVLFLRTRIAQIFAKQVINVKKSVLCVLLSFEAEDIIIQRGDFLAWSIFFKDESGLSVGNSDVTVCHVILISGMHWSPAIRASLTR